MQFEFAVHASLPPLAWCARVERGRAAARVWCGAGVERVDGGFVEGAWDGPFAQGRFAESAAFAGSGGSVVPEGFLFAAATDKCDRILSVRAGGAVYVSNSLVFLWERIGDGPDPRHLFYSADLRRYYAEGIRSRRNTLRGRSGRQVAIHRCGNLLVGPDLVTQRLEKPVPPPPGDYAGYVGDLSDMLGRVFENAADPLRSRCYAPLSSVSEGYDCNAVAVLARHHGCDEAFTLRKLSPDDPASNEGGHKVAQQLRLGCVEHDRLAYRRLGRGAEAEFLSWPGGLDLPMAGLDDVLRGRLLLSGRYGDSMWSFRGPERPDLQQPDPDSLDGTGLTELRLRVGFLHMAPICYGWQHLPRVHAIAAGESMRDWSVGGEYDRPIPRRILEEAGVPRASFGQVKLGGAFLRVISPEQLGEESCADYLAFRASLPAPGMRHHAHQEWRRRHRAFPKLVPRPKYPQRPDSMAHGFQWAVERLRARYSL